MISFSLYFEFQVTTENRKLTKPLQESQIELADLRKKLEHFNKERSALSRVRMQSAASTKELNLGVYICHRFHPNLNRFVRQDIA